MTPAARYAAAIAVLDDILAGAPAEKSLTSWARGNRFAGSKDRAALRDHVYDVLRAMRSLGGLGGGASGRHLILGLLRRDGIAPDTVFGAGGYGPAALSDEERGAAAGDMSQAAACDMPDWLWPHWQASLEDAAVEAALVQQNRAPVFLRVNQRRTDRDGAITRLAQDGVLAVPHPEVKSALEVIENERRIRLSGAFLDGLVDLQDAASQSAIAMLDIAPGAKVLDYCAGGGGKALAMADLFKADVTAHDIAPARMADIPERAARAGVRLRVAGPQDLGVGERFDLVLCDAPCSGSGTWRRTPDAKWRLTPQKLLEYNRMQADVVVAGAGHVGAGGALAYATCSVLHCENDDIVTAFCATRPEWQVAKTLRLAPSALHDGFFMIVLNKMITALG